MTTVDLKEFKRSLFLESYCDLRARVNPRTSPYRVLRMCLLLRQLIGNDDRLAEIVAAEHGLEIPKYRYRRIKLPPELLSTGWFGLVPSGSDPDVVTPDGTSASAPYSPAFAGRKMTDDDKPDYTWIYWLNYDLYDPNKNPIVERSAKQFYQAGLGALANGLQIRIDHLALNFKQLFEEYDPVVQIDVLTRLQEVSISEKQFAQMIGRLRMYQHLPVAMKKTIPQLFLSDSQISRVVNGYYKDKEFGRSNGEIDLWSLYNLFTSANKSSYLDTVLDKNVNAAGFVSTLAQVLDTNSDFWYFN